MDSKDLHNLNRFVSAQERDYKTALAEILKGRKRSHWMWYIFPQVQGLGFSETSRYYGIKDLKEAQAYLQHPVLGPRLVQITQTLLSHSNLTAAEIFGYPDDLKLSSSMTLFAAVPGADPIFNKVIAQFFNGESDQKTQQILAYQ